MPRARKPKPRYLSFADLPKETLVSICNYLDGDGHGIYYDSFLRTEVSPPVPDDYIAQVSFKHTSDGTHKGSIYPSGSAGMPGQPVLDQMVGVYSLDLYRRIAYDLGIKGSPYGGRGSEARDLHRRILEKLNVQQPTAQTHTINDDGSETFTATFEAPDRKESE